MENCDHCGQSDDTLIYSDEFGAWFHQECLERFLSYCEYVENLGVGEYD